MRMCHTLGLVATISVLLVTMSTLASAQAPDLKVEASDITFSPASDVHYSELVTVNADIHNIGECYIVLGDDTDYAQYSHSFGVDLYRARLRVRTVGGNTVSGRVSIGSFNTGVFTTNNGTWNVITTPNLNVTASSSSLRITLDAGGSIDDLEIDWIAVDRWNVSVWTEVLDREAETYDSGGTTVDRIWPQDISVEFFVGDPDAGGTKINGTKVVGPSQTVQTGSVTYLGDGETTTAQVSWTASQAGHYDMYVRILPGNEPIPNWGNNKAFATLDVYANLDIEVSPSSGGQTLPASGIHKYYGENVTITQSRNYNCQFVCWYLDTHIKPASASIIVTMTHDHDLIAKFHVVGAAPTLSTLGYVTLAIMLVGLGVICLQRNRKRKA